MIAFFDTNVHIDVLRGDVALDEVLDASGGGPIRLSPIVASELLRGATRQATSAVDDLVRRLGSLEPPSWRRCWLEAGRLLPRVFRRHEAIGLARLQNDALLALTARYTGALFVTRDQHFRTLCLHAPFALKVVGD